MTSESRYVSEISDVERYIEGTLLSVISLVAVLGNASLWLVVLTTRSLRTESNYLLLSLSLADLLVSLVSMPVTVVTIFRSRWVFSQVTCRAMGFINMLTLVCSVMSLGLISINRYIKICRPHIYRRVYTNRNILIMTVGVWCLSALLASPPLIGWSVYDYLPRQSFCFCDWTTSVSYTFFMVGACFGGPLLMMSFSNFRILQTFRRSKKRIQPQQQKQPQQQQQRAGASSTPNTHKTQAMPVTQNQNQNGNVREQGQLKRSEEETKPVKEPFVAEAKRVNGVSEPKPASSIILVVPVTSQENSHDDSISTCSNNVSNSLSHVNYPLKTNSDAENMNTSDNVDLHSPSRSDHPIQLCSAIQNSIIDENLKSDAGDTKGISVHVSSDTAKLIDDDASGDTETESKSKVSEGLPVGNTSSSNTLQVPRTSQTLNSRASSMSSKDNSTKPSKSPLKFVLPEGSKAALEEESYDAGGNVTVQSQTGSGTTAGDGKQTGNHGKAGNATSQSQTSLVKAIREQKREKRRNEEFQLAVSLMVVILVFVLCWLPFCVTMFLSVFAPETLHRAADMFTLMLGYSNSCFNPIIYGLMNKNVQEGYKRLLRKTSTCCGKVGRSRGAGAVSVVDSPPSITSITRYDSRKR